MTDGIIASMIAPWKKRLINYNQSDKQSVDNNGLLFQGVSFSGELAARPNMGTVLVTRKSNVVYIFYGLCPRKEEADKFDVIFSDFVKSFYVIR